MIGNTSDDSRWSRSGGSAILTSLTRDSRFLRYSADS